MPETQGSKGRSPEVEGIEQPDRRGKALGLLVALLVVSALAGMFNLAESSTRNRLVASSPTPVTSRTPSPPPAGTLRDWPQSRFDIAGTGLNPEARITAANVSHLSQIWQVGILPAFLATPAVVNGVVYITNANSLYAYDLHTGAQLWRFGGTPQTQGNISSSVAIDTRLGLAFYGSPDARVYAVDTQTGRQVWQSIIGDAAAGAHIWSSPLVVNGKVYVGLASHDAANSGTSCVRGGVFAFDETTGAMVWTHYLVPAESLGGGVWSSLVALPTKREVIATTGSPCPQGAVVNQEDAFVGLDWDSGDTLWQYTTLPSDTCDCGFGQGAVALAYQSQEYVIGGSQDGLVYALRPPISRFGAPHLVWSKRIAVSGAYRAGGIYQPPTYYRGIIYIAGGPTPDGTCPQGALHALRVTDGALLWRICTPSQVTSASALTGGLLFVAQDNLVAAYSIANGQQAWSASYKGEARGGVAISHGYLLLGLASGVLQCYGIPGVSG